MLSAKLSDYLLQRNQSNQWNGYTAGMARVKPDKEINLDQAVFKSLGEKLEIMLAEARELTQDRIGCPISHDSRT